MTDKVILHISETFGKVPEPLMHNPAITDGAMRLYAHMHWRAGQSGMSKEGIESMARYLDVTDKTISNRIDELEAHDWVVSVERNPGGETGNFRTRIYHVFEKQQECCEFRLTYKTKDDERIIPKPEVSARKSRKGVGGNPRIKELHERQKLNSRQNSGSDDQQNSGSIGGQNLNSARAQNSSSVNLDTPYLDSLSPDSKNKRTLSDVPSDAPRMSEPSSEKKAERPKNPLQEAVCFAFYLKPGGYAGKLGKWLTGGDVEGEEYQRNPIEEPATPEEIVGWRLWLEDKYDDADKAKRFRPQKIKGIRESFEDHFRGAADHEKWLKKGAKQLDRLLGIQRVIFEPAPDVRPPLEVNMPPSPSTSVNDDFESFNAEIEAGVAELMHIFGDHAGASNEKDRAWLLARKQAYLESQQSQQKKAG